VTGPADTQPVDLTRRFGEGWCVTLARLPAHDTLGQMGVPAPFTMPDGLAQATRRLTTPDHPPRVLLLARMATPHWTLVLELEGSTGWTGMQPDILAELSTLDDPACTIMRDPNQVVAMFAHSGRVHAGLDLITGRRWGTPGTELEAALTVVGLDEDTTRWTASQRAALAAQAATGVRLTDDIFTDPWIAGITTH
jgi:hypothetical protein